MSGPSLPESSPCLDLVVDASVAVKWFVPEIHATEAQRLLDARLRRHIPALLYTEVSQTIWKKVYQRGEIAADDGREILRGLLITPLEVHPTTPLLESAFNIAVATGRTVYDSIYLALATTLGCKLVTADQKLYNALQGGPFAADVLWVADPI
jgi:predicted nucleic acid-binding protein